MLWFLFVLFPSWAIFGGWTFNSQIRDHTTQLEIWEEKEKQQTRKGRFYFHLYTITTYIKGW